MAKAKGKQATTKAANNKKNDTKKPEETNNDEAKNESTSETKESSLLKDCQSFFKSSNLYEVLGVEKAATLNESKNS